MTNTTSMMLREYRHVPLPRFAVSGPADSAATTRSGNPAPDPPDLGHEPRADRRRSVADGLKPNRPLPRPGRHPWAIAAAPSLTG